jgi:hypothetical protein
MKIEIDLDDIFRDEDGNPEESLQDSIRRQVIDKLSGDLRKKMFARIDTEISSIMRDQIDAVMKEKMPELIDDIMNATYVPVSSYGQKSEPTTFRTELINAVSAQMTYEPQDYSTRENAFTKAVKSIVEAKTKEVRDHITKEIDVKFKEDAIKFAVQRLSERLGLDKK